MLAVKSGDLRGGEFVGLETRIRIEDGAYTSMSNARAVLDEETRGDPMATVDIEMLRNQPLLEGARLDVVEDLAKVAMERRFRPGQVIFEESSTGRELYLVIEGLVEVVKGQGAEEMVLARRGTGDFFGEMGLIEASPRFATIRALEPTRLLEFSEQELNSVLIQQPCCYIRSLRYSAPGCARLTCR